MFLFFKKVFYNSPFRELEPNTYYSINMLRKVLYGEVNWGVDKMYYNLNSWSLCFVERKNLLGFIVIIVTFLDLINTLKFILS